MPDRLRVNLTEITPDYEAILDREATALGVPPDLARRIMSTESGGRPDAVSPKGAIGLMQLMPETAKEMGVDPTDPVQNIRGGLRYFKQQLDAHNGDPTLALAAYNAGPGAVKRAGGVPNFKETQDYIRRINPTQSSTPAAGRITVPIGEVQRITVPLTDLQSPEEAEGSRLVGQMKAAGNAPPKPRTPGAIPPPSSFERTRPQEIVEGLRKYSVLPTVGSIAGGMAGAAAGGPSVVGIPAAAVAGSAAGAGLGETGQIALEKSVGLHTGPPTPRILREGAFGAVGEVGGQVVAKGLTKVAAPFAKKVTTEGMEAMRALKGKVLPAQATESRTLDILQNVAEGSLFGGGRVKAFKETQDKLVDELADQALAKYGGRLSSEEAGLGFQTALEGAVDTFHNAGGRLYRIADSLADGAVVPTQSFAGFTAEELTKRGAIPGEVTGDSGLRLLREFSDLAKDVVKETPASTLVDASGRPLREAATETFPNTITFEQAHFLRGQLLKKIRLYEREADDVARGIAEQLVKRLDTAMDEGAIGLTDQAKTAWRAANDFWREGKKQYETKFLRGLLNREPDAAAKSLMRNNSPTLIRQARQAVPEREWRPIQAALQTSLIEGATNPETGSISGRAMLTKIKSLGASLPEIFPQTHDEVKRLGRILSTVQSSQGEGTGRMAIQLAQSGAAIKTAQVVLTAGAFSQGSSAGGVGAGVILIGPAALARIMTSPRGIRWLTTGLTAPPGTALAARAASNLATFLSAGEADRSEAEVEDDQGPPRPSTVRTQSTVRTAEGPPAPRQRGLLTAGNVDLFAQPTVQNPDGSTSTVHSRSYNFDGKEHLLPAVTPDGRHLQTDDEIIAEFKKTGRHLGIFDTPDSATAYAKRLHEDYAAGKYAR